MFIAYDRKTLQKVNTLYKNKNIKVQNLYQFLYCQQNTLMVQNFIRIHNTLSFFLLFVNE